MSTCDCDWDLDLSSCCDDLSDTDQVLMEDAITKASIIMTRLSGLTIGQCPETLRPLDICRECRTVCCGGADGIFLEGPNGRWVESVTAVWDGADTVDPSTYRFDRERQVLWRVPGNYWPRRDTRWDECGEGKAFCVDAVLGASPDAWSLSVATSLACELLKSCTGRKCRLPLNATQVVGQGITVTLSDEQIKTLIPEVEGWAKVVNPAGSLTPPAIHSPDLGHYYRGR